MRALVPALRRSHPSEAIGLRSRSGAVERAMKPLVETAANSDFLIAGSVGEFAADDGPLCIPRFIFMGPKGGGETIRLGIFAAFHGDEPEGTEALVAFLLNLEERPAIAQGCHIYAYPICNPAGFTAQTRHNAAGQDLAAHFWRGSSHPEVYYLEREMGVHCFQGIISLHCGEHPGFLGQTRSSILNAALVKPALDSAQKFLPGLLQEAVRASALSLNEPAAFLTVGDELNPPPFEINFSLPRRAPHPSLIYGTVSALRSIVESYRTLLALRQNI